MKQKIVLIDFDSTFVIVESLDQLAEIVLAERPDKQAVLGEIVAITKDGMEGKITFSESLTKRFDLLRPHKKHIEQLSQLLHSKITPSFKRNKNFFVENANRVFILSGGFADYMVPVLTPYGILEDHILGNTFTFDENGNSTGYDMTNPLTGEKGKVKMIQKMKFDAPLYMVGDGFTDYEIKKEGLVEKFFAFTENITRQIVVENADVVANTFEEVLKNL